MINESRIQTEVTKFINIISNNYSIETNVILYRIKSYPGLISKNIYFRLTLLIQVYNFTKEIIFDVPYEDEHIDFNYIYEQTNKAVSELVESVDELK